MENNLMKNKFTLRILGKIAISLIVISISIFTISILTKQINRINLTMAEQKEMNYLISNRETVNNNIKNDFLEVDPNYREKITIGFPPVFNILPFVDSIESLGKKYSFKQSLNFNQPIPATESTGPLSLMLINFSLNITDINSDNFILFLKDFEQLPYFTSITSINYLSGKSGWQENSTINITGHLYAHE